MYLSDDCGFGDHGEMRPALDAAVNLNSLQYARQRHTISDGNVVFEKGARVLHIVLTAPQRLSICVLLTHLFIQKLISRLDSRTLRAVNVLGFLDFSNNV